MQVYGETKLRVCSGTLAMTGPKRKGYFRVELIIDKTGTEQMLEPGDILKLTPVAARSAFYRKSYRKRRRIFDASLR